MEVRFLIAINSRRLRAMRSLVTAALVAPFDSGVSAITNARIAALIFFVPAVLVSAAAGFAAAPNAIITAAPDTIYFNETENSLAASTATQTQTQTPTGCPSSITQSTSLTITSGTSVSCNRGSPGFIHTDNSYYRAFFLSSFSIPGPYTITSVTVGIESANDGAGAGQPITAILYASSTNPPTLASLGLPRASITTTIPDQTLSLFMIPITATFAPTEILVVEIFTPDGLAGNNSLLIGSNGLGQSGPSFIRASSCGINDITDLTVIGLPSMHIVMRVSGSCAPAPTPTPTVNISGTVLYCSNPIPGLLPNVTLSLTGSGSGSTLSNGSGNYQFSSLASGGSYTVTPAKSALTPGAAGINTIDVVATQRHFLNLGTLLSGCRLMAADVNSDAAVNTIDVIAIQRFFLALSTGLANVGKYQFSPASRSYTPLLSSQTGQDYDTLIFGDVVAPFAE